MNADPAGGTPAGWDEAAKDDLAERVRAVFADAGEQPVPVTRVRSEALQLALEVAFHPSVGIRWQVPVVQVLATTDPQDPHWPALRTPRQAATAGILAYTGDGVPVVLCDVTDHRYRFRCPRCDAWHHHGPQPGHRVGHCESTRETGIFVLTLADALNLESAHAHPYTPLRPADLDLRLTDGELRAGARAAHDAELLDGLWRIARAHEWFDWHDVRLPRPVLNRLVVDGVLFLSGSKNHPVWSTASPARALKILTKAIFEASSTNRGDDPTVPGGAR